MRTQLSKDSKANEGEINTAGAVLRFFVDCNGSRSSSGVQIEPSLKVNDKPSKKAISQTPAEPDSSTSSLNKLENILKEVSMAVVADVKHGLMRIISPVVEIENLESEHYKKCLKQKSGM